MTKPLIALFASIILFFSCATKSAIISEKVDTFDRDKVSEIAYELAREYPDSTQLSIALLDSGMVHFVGLMRMDDTLVSVDNADQNFEIGSISKVFTSTLLASMVVDGKIDLDAPISRYIEVSSELEHEITLRSLANHTSGLPRLPSNLLASGFDPNNPYGSYDEENIKEFFAEQVTTQTAPGEKYDYSNIGAGALGYLLTKASGSSYEDLLQTKICKKYDMPNTTTSIANIESNLVKGRNNAGAITPNWDLNTLVGAGGIFSTVRDMSHFAKAQFSTESKELHLTQQPTHSISDHMDIALSWHILHQDDGSKWLWHNGGTGGYTSSMALDINKKKGVIILSNVSAFNSKSGNIDKLCFELLRDLKYLNSSPLPKIYTRFENLYTRTS